MSTPSTSKILNEWQMLSDQEKQARIKAINAQCDTGQAVQERIKHSGIPRKYQKAQITPALKNLFEKLEQSEIAGLVFQGETGRGKTLSACAILIEHLKSQSGSFATMNDILNRVRAAYSSGESPDEIFGRYRGTKLLVIDDLGKENVSADSITRLFELLDTRINNGRATIITTQFSNQELLKRYTRKVDEPEMIEAILSRLTQFTSIAFKGEDRRAR